MEALGVQSDIITKMSNNSWILPFYDYAYESIKMLRSLCQDTRNLYIDQQEAFIKILKKQTIDLRCQKVDKNTIKVLKRGDRYKLFKFIIELDNDYPYKCEVIYNILEDMPEIEIHKIYVKNGTNGMIDILTEKPMFDTKQELYKVLEFQHKVEDTYTETYEYISELSYPDLYDMS